MAPGRGAPGRFRLERRAGGRWRLLDPRGEACFLRAVHGVEPTPAPDDGGLVPDTAGRLRAWGFNALGLGAESVRADGLPYLAEARLAAGEPLLTGPGLRLPDVFDPDWGARAAARAAVACAPQTDQPALVGWVSDAGLGWAQRTESGRPSLLQQCLALEPSRAAYHAAWEFVLALHGGTLEGVARAWGHPWTNREQVRELTRAERGIAHPAYAADAARWSREFARRYFTAAAAALRAADPGRLVLGCPLGPAAGPEIAAECTYPAVDLTLVDWRDLPVSAAPQPLLADAVGWSQPDFRLAAPGRRRDGLTTVERMLRRARSALRRLEAHPGVVGFCWARWRDDAGDRPPFGPGLLHHEGTEAPENTELIAAFNARCHPAARA